MSARLARLALRLYPLAFQRRYGAEIRALLEDRPARPSTVAGLVRGAVVAHVHPPAAAAAWADPVDRARASASGVLVCWVLFAAVGLGFYKTTEDAGFSDAGHAHAVLFGTHVAIEVMAVIGSAGVVLGALPSIVVALARAGTDRALRRIVGRALVPVGAFAVATAGIVMIAHGGTRRQGTEVGYTVATVWGVFGIGCAVACALACRAALFALPPSPARLRVAVAGGVVVAGATLAITLATAVYAAGLLSDASPLAALSNGPYQVVTVGESLVVEAIAMVALAALTTTAAFRGWRLRGRLSASSR
jgi:hypothetical protein